MRVDELVGFSKESFFNGAVQTDWFYDDERVRPIAESYVFHGPKYYGVTSNDVKTGEHQLMDTASFAKVITNKLYSENAGNSFVMTIAGYGTGKSHLAVCLGALFSGDKAIAASVEKNIASADSQIGEYIQDKNKEKNLVIILNGMNNFNLDAEVLRCARLSLAQHGISDEILKKLTKSYDVACHFVDRTFEIYHQQFEQASQEIGLELTGADLKRHLIGHVENDSRVLSVINKIYTEVNGVGISWDRGLSAGDVLHTLEEELCGEGKPFNKILLMFDEFGRYIEYTAANPAIAGEAALQQIFEATQSSDGKIIFVGFIQSELEAYLSRIEKSSNITRYLERYRTASENLFLSSNFETILANILKKSQPEFARVVGNSINRYENYHRKIKNALTRWDRSATKKSVWTEDGLYNNVILEGCYPLHPITVWVLSSLHQWMQQRSTLAFAAEMFETVSQDEVDQAFLPYVYPYQIVDSGIFGEMLNSEDKGLVSSQYCLIYRDILVKVGDKLSELEKRVLKAVLVTKIGRMSFRDKEDAFTAIRICSDCKEDEAKHALASLEEMHGIVAFDENSKTYELIGEPTGFNDFKRIFLKYRIGTKASISDIDDTVRELVMLNTAVETSFAQENHISSTEWAFVPRLVDSTAIVDEYLKNLIRSIAQNNSGDIERGVLIYAYCASNADAEVERLCALYRRLEIENYPIVILFLNDPEGEILSALTQRKTLMKFSAADRERFKKHILDQKRKNDNTISRIFVGCVAKRVMIGENGLVTYAGRINALCSKRFSEVYTKPVPFVFDGFENKSKAQAKATLISICCYMYNRLLMSDAGYSSLATKDKNRVTSVLSVTSPYAWKVFDKNLQLVSPENSLIREMIDTVIQTLEDGERHSVYDLFYPYTQAPYSMNENSIALLVTYFISYQENQYHYFYNGEYLAQAHWSSETGKLKLPEMRKLVFVKNAHADVDHVAELCSKVMANKNVENCNQLRDALAGVIKREGISDTNKFRVSQANAYLDEGIRLSGVIRENYQKIRTNTDNMIEKFNIPAFVKIFELIPDTSDVIEDGWDYLYSDTYKAQIQKVQKDVRALLEHQYMHSLSSINCKVTQLSEFKKRYGQAAQILKSNGYDDYAEATEHRVSEVETNLMAQQKYESSLVECEKDIAQSGNIPTIKACEEMRKRLESWAGFVERAHDLPESLKTSLSARIGSAIGMVDRRKQDILSNCDSTIRAVRRAQSVVELKQLDTKLGNILQQQVDENRQNEIVQTQESIKMALDCINDLPQNIDELTEFIATSPKAREGICSVFIVANADSLRTGFEETQRAWMNRFVNEAERTYSTMSPQACQIWLDKTENIPKCFQASAVERIFTVRKLIEKQLHNSRVEGLYAEYNSLSEAEKNAFRALLNNG